MKKILILIVLGFNCSVDRQTMNENNPQTDTASTGNETSRELESNFMDFVSLLSKVELPYKVECEACCGPDSDGLSVAALSEALFPELFDYIPGGSNLWLLDKTKDKVIILATFHYQSSHPLIVVCDLNGNMLGAESFFQENCGLVDKSASKQYLSIYSDLSIITVDTTYYFEVTDDYDILDTTEIEIIKKHFIIDNTGHIVEEFKYDEVADKLSSWRREHKSFIQTDIDTSLFFGTWSNPDGRDFIFSKNSYFRFDGNGYVSYELVNKSLTIFYEDLIVKGEIISVDKNTLKIKWMASSQIDSYTRLNK